MSSFFRSANDVSSSQEDTTSGADDVDSNEEVEEQVSRVNTLSSDATASSSIEGVIAIDRGEFCR